MLLNQVIQGLSYEWLQGDMNKRVTGVTSDSREVKAGGVFVAISGFTADGHQFIGKAVINGASVVIVEKDIEERDFLLADEQVTVLKVRNARDALARIATNFFGNLSAKMNLIGVTGTNGKTSITYFLQAIFEQAGQSLGIIGTMGTVIGSERFPTTNTTPEPVTLQKIFSRMRAAEVKDCVMEVSSHGLILNRVAYTRFNIGIFTNLTPDHLELHRTMEDYFEAKALLFGMTSDFNIFNADDPYGRILIQRFKRAEARTITYGIRNKADFYASHIEYYLNHTTYILHTPKGESMGIRVNLPGEIYVYNSLAAIAAAYCNQISLTHIAEGISSLTKIQGRLEVVYEDSQNRIIVDFAHTEDALEQTLKTVRAFTKGRVLLVFGVYADESAAGQAKRKGMARVASAFADFSVITTDNPKEHDNETILHEIEKGMASYKGSFITVTDRRKAIDYAISSSSPGDIIVIAGKGHETSQVIGKENLPFNDAEIVLQIQTDRHTRVQAKIVLDETQSKNKLLNAR